MLCYNFNFELPKYDQSFCKVSEENMVIFLIRNL